MIAETPLLVERVDGYLRLTLQRPKQRNALNAALCLAMQEALSQAASDSGVRAVLLRADGPFCAGLDVGELDYEGRPATEITAPIERHLNPLIETLARMTVPVVCAVSGAAAGAGFGLTLACDYVLASEEAIFLCAFSRLGLSPDSGVSFHLSRSLGERTALAVAMMDEPISAQHALSLGLVWRVVSREALEAEAEALTQTLARKATKALSLTKRAILGASMRSLEEQLAYELRLQMEAVMSHDAREGLAAIRERRPPVFEGQ
ncbi:MAG: enoyl-CoA hydratase-related protein [Sphingomonas sp.]